MDRNAYLNRRQALEERLERSRGAFSRDIATRRQKWSWVFSMLSLVPKGLPATLIGFLAPTLVKRFFKK